MAARRTTTRKPRTFTVSERLRAVASMIAAERPGGFRLAVPTELRVLDAGAVGDPLVSLRLPGTSVGVHPIRRWADALVDVTVVELAEVYGDDRGRPGASVEVRVVGRIPRGPVVEVRDFARVDSVTLRRYETRPWSLDELRAADDARFGGGR